MHVEGGERSIWDGKASSGVRPRPNGIHPSENIKNGR